ncbi:MAG: hypothetical protein JRI54_03495, partial [Deltaproteobacteria bacterium]|nr:hypothetical protein [Deltaproteobacteria bacterium]
MPKRHISGLLITFCLCLVLLLAGCAAKKGFGPTQFKPGNLKKKIAVIPFENNTDFGRADLGRRIADSIAQQLAQSGKVIIVPHTKV